MHRHDTAAAVPSPDADNGSITQHGISSSQQLQRSEKQAAHAAAASSEAMPSLLHRPTKQRKESRLFDPSIAENQQSGEVSRLGPFRQQGGRGWEGRKADKPTGRQYEFETLHTYPAKTKSREIFCALQEGTQTTMTHARVRCFQRRFHPLAPPPKQRR